MKRVAFLAERYDHIWAVIGVFFREVSRHPVDMRRFGESGEVQKLGKEVYFSLGLVEQPASGVFSGNCRCGQPFVVRIEDQHAWRPADDFSPGDALAQKYRKQKNEKNSTGSLGVPAR